MEKKNIFIICSVRGMDGAYRNRLESYVTGLEQKGHSVHLPHRDTDQEASSIEICGQNFKAIDRADEVHVFYRGESQGAHFDMGVSFALNKKLVVVENEPITEGKSFPKMLSEWERLG
jgi:hypothetical protein